MSELLLEKLAREVSDEEMKKIKRKYLGLGAGIGALTGAGAGILSGSAVAKKVVFPKIDKQMQPLRDEETAIHNEALKSLELRREGLKNKEENLGHLPGADKFRERVQLGKDSIDLIRAESKERARNLIRNSELNDQEYNAKIDALKKAKKLGLGGGAGTGATAGAVIGNALARRKINKLLNKKRGQKPSFFILC